MEVNNYRAQHYEQKKTHVGFDRSAFREWLGYPGKPKRNRVQTSEPWEEICHGQAERSRGNVYHL